VSGDLVRQLFDDFNRAEFESAFAKIDQDVEWGEPPDMPDTGGTYRGHDAMVRGFRRFMGAWEELRVDLDEVIEESDRVVALTHWVGRSRSSGIEVDTRIAQVYEFRGGKVARVRQFRTLGEALGAA
jgi:ketosteroid isomerase-like protein